MASKGLTVTSTTTTPKHSSLTRLSENQSRLDQRTVCRTVRPKLLRTRGWIEANEPHEVSTWFLLVRVCPRDVHFGRAIAPTRQVRANTHAKDRIT